MTRTRVKTDPSVRTYYLLFDGKTLLTKRPNQKVKAVQRASSTREAREKLATRFALIGGVFRSRIRQEARPLPTHQPTMKDKVREMAAADARNYDPIDLGEVLAEADRLVAASQSKAVIVVAHGITLTLQRGSSVDCSTPDMVSITAPSYQGPETSDLDLAQALT